MPQRHFLKLVTVSLALTTACKGDRAGGIFNKGDEVWAPARLTSVAGIPEAQIEAALKARLAGRPPGRIDNHKWAHAKRLYKIYGDNPLWLAEDGIHTQRVFALTNALLNTESDAMRMDAYPIGELATAIAAIRGQKPTAEQLVNAEVLLTAAYVAIGVDYLIGQIDPRTVSQNWHIDRHEENEDSALIRSIRNPALDKAIASMRPAEEDYAGLMKELAHYRAIVAAGGWASVPEGKGVKPGESDNPARVAALRARLAAEGINVPAATTPGAASPADSASAARTRRSGSAIYDRALAAAVGVFQARHGIVVDSTLGPETVNALNVPATFRLGQIAANLERYRWLPRTLGERYVVANVPAFRLEAYDNAQKVLEMKVIVGQEYEDRATPVFADSMETVVFRPYWNVPPGIASKEIFPKLASNPGYLEANDMETYREGGETRIRQRPGRKNALGLVKFLFPNDFNIYFHDTPFDELFEKDIRAFSHGCIRLEKPDLLAQYALGWPLDRIRDAMENGPNNRGVKLPRKIPVYIIYATTYIRDGQLYFGNDLYHRDDDLVPAVAEGAMPSAQTLQAVEALRKIAVTT
jgi:murein L,D-transpeptidase YcbB/YkuD